MSDTATQQTLPILNAQGVAFLTVGEEWTDRGRAFVVAALTQSMAGGLRDAVEKADPTEGLRLIEIMRKNLDTAECLLRT